MKTNSDNIPAPVANEDIIKEQLFFTYAMEMVKETNNFITKEPTAKGMKFYVLQSIMNKKNTRMILIDIANFYNENYIGNKDFIHIPNLEQILENTMYPMLVAIKDGKILGATTIKIENNNSISDNAFFPTQNETVLTITGILTKIQKENEPTIKGIGKELFKIAIKGAYNLNRFKKLRIVCEIDCRNNHSFHSIKNAVKELQDEGYNVNLYIDGYYEICNLRGKLTEAPTFMMEIGLNDKKIINNECMNLSYANCEKDNLLRSISKKIQKNTKEKKQYINIDTDKIITYHAVERVNALLLEIDVANTADGNRREPINIFANSKKKILPIAKS